MNWKWILLIFVVVGAFVLGIGIGIGIPLLLRPQPAGFVLDKLDAASLLEKCKPADAKFIIRPDLLSHRGADSFYVTAFAAWEDPMDARNVVANIQKQFEPFRYGKTR
jgi:hypothetical protein